MISEYSAKKFCCEDISLIENYQQAIADTTQTWDCHHRLEIQGKFQNSRELLKKCGVYFNVPAWQLIFLTRSEHNILHLKGKQKSYATKQKLREANLGKKHSDETKQKMRKAKLGKRVGWHWYNDGNVNRYCKEQPGPDFMPGRLKRSLPQDESS